ncbi:MerR family transcriptional regulator [Mesobacillus zeae]|uniref:Chromosome-anchoring protein RacA n=1 Tax=Mesobacillus zeae TaxID=1917180 RepID=A0A398BGI1_9BACI|nr:MerR family transcriptional regulator [Mesobacillus zeae]RID88301.1 MerR family transcriptional regulator [Mesobacillus zeae]
MNTNAVAKLLGVSQSTIQRWVKQANLKMSRNELGHYVFSEDSIEVLKHIQEQVNNGVLLQEIAAARQTVRTGTVKQVKQPDSNAAVEKLIEKVSDLERRIDGKADDVVTYQLLQHRREIEELNGQVRQLMTLIETLEQQNESKEETVPDLSLEGPSKLMNKFKKKKIIGMLFGF